ncbi:TPA: DUF3265 domain-containing protein [Vibrio vulnificus]|nr:DUF3265 domain-containing protein [Vibrio vulnificus]
MAFVGTLKNLTYNNLTNGSRGTTNAWYFYYVLFFVVKVLCGKLVVALVAP